MVAGTIGISGKRVMRDVNLPAAQQAARWQLSRSAPDARRTGAEAHQAAMGGGIVSAEVARRADIRPETLNRIERTKVTADTATVTKIAGVLAKAEREQSPTN